MKNQSANHAFRSVEKTKMPCDNLAENVGQPTSLSPLARLAMLSAACPLLLLHGCSGGDDPGKLRTGPARPPTISVETAHPAVRDVSRLITLPADVKPYQEATLYAKVPGTLASLLVDRGDQVKPGQLIATINASELSADADSAKAAAAAADASAIAGKEAVGKSEADARKADSELQRSSADIKSAEASERTSRDLAAQADAAVKQAEEQKNQAASAVEEARALLEKTRTDTQAAMAEHQLAKVTYERYKGIYARNPMLLAKQELDTAETKNLTTESRAASAQVSVKAAEAHLKSVEGQKAVAEAQIAQASAAARAAHGQMEIASAKTAAAKLAGRAAAQELASRQQSTAISASGSRESRSKYEAALSAAKKARAVADYMRILSPFAGTVTRRSADPGAFIQTAAATTSATPIVTISDLTKLRIQVNVPELESAHVTAGGGVIISNPAVPALKIKAKIARTSGTLDPKSRTLGAEIELPNVPTQLTPGSYALVRVVLETHRGVISVPAGAVGSDKSGKFVYAVSGGEAVRKNVEIGFSDGEFTEIKTGLTPDDEVVVTGRDAVTPHGPVNASPYVPKAPPAAAK
jgi:RND family efflux transporter MFP subunit